MRLAAVIGTFAVGGCSYQLSSLASKSGTDGEQTGALGQSAHEADAVPPPEADLAYARAVAADALARGKDDSVPWHNPDTGAGGNITPLAASYGEGTLTCRDFRARAWADGGLARRGLPHRPRQVGGEESDAAQPRLIGYHCADAPIRCCIAARVLKSHIHVWLGGRGRPEKLKAEFMGDA